MIETRRRASRLLGRVLKHLPGYATTILDAAGEHDSYFSYFVVASMRDYG
jgi:hypothetical protein